MLAVYAPTILISMCCVAAILSLFHWTQKLNKQVRELDEQIQSVAKRIKSLSANIIVSTVDDEVSREIDIYLHATSPEGTRERILGVVKKAHSDLKVGDSMKRAIRHELPGSSETNRMAWTYLENYSKVEPEVIDVAVTDENENIRNFSVKPDDDKSLASYVNWMMEVERGKPTSDY